MRSQTATALDHHDRLPEHGLCIEFVIRSADAALYRAKNEGRDAVRLAS